ncbi:nucleotidyltransferase family protein [Sphingorhabdus sp.]|uniref:nucleotidyltransferase domain-containing protein n=1 Tax=Sphingorhabdus sp. TaxID=1902408 RepID=UPI0035B2EEE8
MLLVDALRNPATTRNLDAQGWTELLSMARAEQLLGTLAERFKTESVPPKVAEILAEAQVNADYLRRSALWEADCARRALAGFGGKVVLLKGTAYVAAGLKAGEGRSIGDLDILVARDDLPQVEAALLAAGWEWVKPDPYDDAYYRDHMHELPPLIHKLRDRMIDVHHTILPLTARQTPDAAGMLGAAIPLPPAGGVRGGGEQSEPYGISGPPLTAVASQRLRLPASGREGLYILSPTDMVCHGAAHLFADGDLAGGLRNLWDVHCLLGQFSSAEFWVQLRSRASLHQLSEPVERAVRLAHQLYGTQIPKDWAGWHRQDKWYVARLTARDGWGRPTRKFIRLLFYIRSHWLRMPPLMLARHLWVKWRKG